MRKEEPPVKRVAPSVIRNPRAGAAEVAGPPSPGIRLQKVLAGAGIASRRAAEELIVQGRVEVNGRIVSELGVRVHPGRDEIRVDKKPVALAEQKIYVVLNKPRQIITTAKDPQGRQTVFDLLPDLGARLFPAGRLDYDSEGLLLLTNDGELTNRLMHPRYGVSKTYEVKVKGIPGEPALDRLRSGVVLEEGKTAPAEVLLLRTLPSAAWVRIVLHQGWNRQIRRMAEAVGHPALKIRRVAYGPLKLGELGLGRHRFLKPFEVSKLYLEAGLADGH